ncbi:c-type cytochrome [Roseiarcus sp.]|uniref:c-type cytochrome n=1 Tax=Roseiarcus sp. TaxID=1969460 RepID=UPI003F96C9A5
MAARRAAWAAVLAAAILATGAASAQERYGLGRPATQAEIAQWNIDVAPDGEGLPVGTGSARQGEAIFANHCASCHGDRGQGHPMDRLVGGAGTIATKKPVKTVGSFWPYATTLFDFVRRAMPFDAPQSLSPSETYAVCAYVLFLNGILPADATLDAKSLPLVRMPNRDAFVSAYKTGPR